MLLLWWRAHRLANSCKSKTRATESLLTANPGAQASATWWHLPHWFLATMSVCIQPAGEESRNLNMVSMDRPCSLHLRFCWKCVSTSSRGWEMYINLCIRRWRAGFDGHMPLPTWIQISLSPTVLFLCYHWHSKTVSWLTIKWLVPHNVEHGVFTQPCSLSLGLYLELKIETQTPGISIPQVRTNYAHQWNQYGHPMEYYSAIESFSWL